ncbi:MAG: 23S rRNA (guanosine(2251)-2'-O)-methyltransferase RlmB [Actinobacteria bacterium HGW-Actinobacteria-6]|nr:MAG: 23S rRNA (guanosine(2251)-2'-O)-methyltransferase RlmB [Actinobacteria bacterium HGW-Actinobacteria-6]
MSSRIEGRNAVAEALRSGQAVTRLLVAKGMRTDPLVDEILMLASGVGASVTYVDRVELDRESERGRHQGIVAYAGEFKYATLSALMAKVADKDRSLVVVLDHVTDPGNFGAAIRSAEVAGADGIIVADRRSAPVTAVVHKAAAGATSHLPVVQVTNIVQTLGLLKDAGYWIAGATERGRDSLWTAPLDGRLVIVLGSEGSGLSRLVAENCDFLVRIPVAGQVESLNVAQAATLLAFEWMRRGADL